MTALLVLYDIDGTLISSGGAGRRAMLRAFADAAGGDDGRAASALSFSFAGRTDRSIVREGLGRLAGGANGAPGEVAEVAHGGDVGNVGDVGDRIDGLLERYLAHLREEIARAADVRVHRGIEASLGALEARGRARPTGVGLGTGNVREGAKAKLGRVRLFERFAFGGFGCDSEDRAELLWRGAERGADLLAVPLGACRVVVVGDTPRDVDAARTIGAESIAVATGEYDVLALARAGATHACESLEDLRALELLLG